MSVKNWRLVELVADGLKNKDIAAKLGTTEMATKERLRKLYDKLGFSNRVELALWYVKRMDERTT